MNRAGDLINGDIKGVVDDVSENLTISTISHDGSQVVISGKADNEQPVLQYVRNLFATERYSQITITAISVKQDNDGNNYVEYSLTGYLRGDRN
jgi:pyruvate-formate lyase-activating enzyme